MTTQSDLVKVPHVDAEMEFFWAAVQKDVLHIKRCVNCNEAHFYPRNHCPFCGSLNTKWERSSGLGTLYSFTWMMGEDDGRAVAIVTLSEGPMLTTNLFDVDVQSLKIGDALVFKAMPVQGATLALAFTVQKSVG